MAVRTARMVMASVIVLCMRMCRMIVIIMVMVFMMWMLITGGMRFTHCKFPLIDISDAG